MRIERHTAGGWWLEEAGEPTPRPALNGDVKADVVVIGGGFTGLWTAWHLLEANPGARVALLEGDVCGHGPSGRNGGFCESMWLSAAPCASRFGDAAARRAAGRVERAVGAIGDWCRANDVDAWFDQSGYMCVSTAPGFDDVGAAAAEAAAALGAPERVVELDEAAVRARCDSPVFRGGVMVPDFATLHPARLALGLRARLIERGALVYEHSPSTRCRRAATETACGWRPRTDRSAPAPRCSRWARGPRRARAALASLGHLLAHSPHRAGAEAARRARLDRRRVHHRRPHARALLPHHARPADRVRLGRRAARPSARGCTGAPRWTTDVAAEAHALPAADLPLARGHADHARLGRARGRVPQPHPADRQPARRAGALRVRLHRQRRRAVPPRRAGRWPRWPPAAPTRSRGCRS